MQEEVEENRKIIKTLRERYKGALQEIGDLKKENQDQSEEQMVTIREQENELQFYQNLVKYLLKPDELSKIRAKSKNLDDGWQIPPFVLKKHEVNFPKLSRGKAKEMVEDELNQRDMEFEDEYHQENSSLNISKSSVKISNHKKNIKSNKALQSNSHVMSPKNSTEMLTSYDSQQPPAYVSKLNSKSQRTGGKKHISVQPNPNNIKNYMNVSYDEEENPAAMRSMKKPNPTLAPIANLANKMPNFTNLNSKNVEVNIPSVDELRRHRGELMPLKHHKLNDSYGSTD